MAPLVKSRIAAAFVGAASFLVYVLTAPQTIYLKDNAEYITAGKILGIPHPPGYPVFVLLAKLFSFWPFGSLPFRINLLGAVSAAAGLVFFYLILRHLTKWEWFSACAALLLGFSPIFWSQSNQAEVYPLHFLVLAAAMWCVLSEKHIFWTAALCGLGLAVHPMFVLFLPIFIWALWQRNIRNARKWLPVALIFVSGLLFYLYLPVASSFHPALDWGQTSRGIAQTLSHILRRSYDDYGGAFALMDKAKALGDFAGNLWTQFSWLLIIAAYGLWRLGRKRNIAAPLSAGIFVLNAFGIIFLRSMPYSLYSAEFFKVYYLPAYAMVVLWMAVGVCAGLEKFPKTALAATAILAVSFFFAGWPAANLRHFTFVEDYAGDILTGLPPRAVLLFDAAGPSRDTLVFAFLYEQAALHLRPDVTVVSYPDIFPSPEAAELNKILAGKDDGANRRALASYAAFVPRFSGRPIYATFLSTSPEIGLASARTEISDSDFALLSNNFFGRDVLADFEYRQAGMALAACQKRASEQAYLSALALDDDVDGADAQGFRSWRAIMQKSCGSY